jgi:hypothetical protein
LPTTMSCTFSPSSASLSGQSPITAAVTVGTQARAGLSPAPFARPTFLAMITTQLSFGLMGIVLVGINRGARRRKAVVLTCGLLILLLAMLSGCGSGASLASGVGSGTQAGTYTMTITGTATDVSPALSHSVTATVIVQ